jgi:HAD superfamily hydrolase (TIGR01549 family)
LISNGNATHQRQKIKPHHLAPFFDAILIEEEFGVAKPNQKIFLEALN